MHTYIWVVYVPEHDKSFAFATEAGMRKFVKDREDVLDVRRLELQA